MQIKCSFLHKDWPIITQKASEPVKVRLACFFLPLNGVPTAFVEQVVHPADGDLLLVFEAHAQLDTAQVKQSSCYRPLCLSQFFLSGTAVFRFMPHRSISSEKIW